MPMSRRYSLRASSRTAAATVLTCSTLSKPTKLKSTSRAENALAAGE